MGYETQAQFQTFGNGTLYADIQSYRAALLFKEEFARISAAIGPGWTDLLVPAQAIPLQGQSGDPDRDTDGTLLFSSIATEQAAVRYQLQHGVVHDKVSFHVHWSKTTDATGDVVWEMQYKLWNLGEVAPAWSEWVAASGRSHDNTGATQMTVLDYFPDIDISEATTSAMLGVQFRRKHDATADNYGADARLEDADLHIQVERFGSLYQSGDTA